MTEGLRLSKLQRARLLSAMTSVACERGAGNVTASDVVAKAGVSRRTFYELFSSCEECLLAAIDDAINRVAAHVRTALEASEDWQEQMRNGLAAMLGFFDAQPMLARLLIVEMLAAGPQARARRSSVLRALVDMVDEGRAADGKSGSEAGSSAREGRTSGSESRLPGLIAQAVVGGVLAVLYERLSTPAGETAKGREPAVGGRRTTREDDQAAGARRQAARSCRQAADVEAPLVLLVPELTGVIVLPYLGAAACQHELERPPVKTDARHEGAEGEHDAAHRLVKDAALRLTARTVMMLAAVAQHPGSSNRVLAEHVGMHDQGQASKLLMRLQSRGLVENAASPSPRGAPNSWRLTARGWRLNELIERQRRD